MSEPRRRMSGKERREQLIQISRTLFAEKGFDGTSVEEIAATANVSKPVVYEHFGGKEGVYAVVVDREMQKLLSMVTEALSASHALIKLERAALALLAYVEENSEGFRILVRDSHAASGTGTFASLINDIASQVEDVMVAEFAERDYDPKLAPMYAQMLVGMVALTGQWWLDVRRPPREEVAAHLVNLAWNGLTGLDPRPRLSSSLRGLEHRRSAVSARPAELRPAPPRPTDKELRELEKTRERELKEQEKAREREQREADKLARELEKQRQRELKELEKARERELKEQQRAREREQREADKLARELEKQRQRELKEQERIRLREARAAEREAARQAKLTASGRQNLEATQ
ncbi:AcrR family transcriptional regulator [Streptosporangium becharense]|uniref:AcrR family transcriptional regulator n=1 Tax=Streptosporangium becharense TaxID=1816182 RepID=A0A7W9IHX2_9ACTN|nr:TetR family transcriptional regulator [Streptosporangium becharense]MBB2913350.1 AcrR family transcriptional regulator [Streptosporangium becharense]MBB5821040.1 AcrR family transcriptional regulator [Streptosporangium becharense]